MFFFLVPSLFKVLEYIGRKFNIWKANIIYIEFWCRSNNNLKWRFSLLFFLFCFDHHCHCCCWIFFRFVSFRFCFLFCYLHVIIIIKFSMCVCICCWNFAFSILFFLIQNFFYNGTIGFNFISFHFVFSFTFIFILENSYIHTNLLQRKVFFFCTSVFCVQCVYVIQL